MLKPRNENESRLFYSKIATPQIYDVIPNQVYRGQSIQYRINPARALDYDMGDSDLNQSELLI